MPEVPAQPQPQVATTTKSTNWKKISLTIVFIIVCVSIIAGIYWFMVVNKDFDDSDLTGPVPKVTTKTSTESAKEATPSAQKKKKSPSETKWVKSSDFGYFSFEYPYGWHVLIDSSDMNKPVIWFDKIPIFKIPSERPPGKLRINDTQIVEGKAVDGLSSFSEALTKEKKDKINLKEETFKVDGVVFYKLTGKMKLPEHYGGGTVGWIQYMFGFRSQTNPIVDHIYKAGLGNPRGGRDQDLEKVLEKILKSIDFRETSIIR